MWETDETVNHIVIECRELAQKEYSTKHDWGGKAIHCELCKRWKFDHATKWYMHKAELVAQNKTHKIFLCFEIQAH